MALTADDSEIEHFLKMMAWIDASVSGSAFVTFDFSVYAVTHI